jgi:hypothetical protein
MIPSLLPPSLRGTELMVTGDRRHLPPVGGHEGIAILTAAEALRRSAAA